MRWSPRAHARPPSPCFPPADTFNTAGFENMWANGHELEGFGTAREPLCCTPVGGFSDVLNRYDRSPMADEAEVKYLDGDFRVVRPRAVGLGNERRGLRCREAVRIGKAAGDRDVDPGGLQRREELLRIADAGKREHATARERRNARGIGHEAAAKHREPARFGVAQRDGPAGPIADHEHRLRPIELRGKRRPQWARGKDLAVADAAPPVDYQDREILA